MAAQKTRPQTSPFLFPQPGGDPWTRRTFLTRSASFAAAALWATGVRGAVTTMPTFSAYPFSLGVASGDPLSDGFVLWTRLAPDPLHGGGMPPEAVQVSWQVAEDEKMTRIVRQGTEVATPEWAHSVHVEVSGLRPERWYWYRFKAGKEVSQVGRTRTAPLPGAMPDRFRFAFASCQKYETGLFTAYEHMAREDVDLVVHLGDYIYEKADPKDGVRHHNTPEIFTLDDYRNRYAVYKLDPALMAMHALAPWIVTWDDHEVSNNYAGMRTEFPEKVSPEKFAARRAAGYQAYYEHMPLRRSTLPSGIDMLLFRRLEFGRLACFHVMDTRQYRTDQPLGDGKKAFDPVLLDPAGTIMGAQQRDWLFDGLAGSGCLWNVMAQQVAVAKLDLNPGPAVEHSMDKWTGYEFERRRLLSYLGEKKASNPVVITGDIHLNWANELLVDFERADSKVVGVEFIGTSISSSGDGIDKPANIDAIYSNNPFVKFHNAERGYVRCEITPKAWRSDYRTVPYVSRKGAPLNTRASFVVENGRAALNRA